MAVAGDIFESWQRPQVVVRRLLDRGRSEPFAFSLLLTFLLLAFLALVPLLRREALGQPDVALMPRLYASGLGLLLWVPLFYLLAALGHLIGRTLGGQGSYYGGRLALFWAAVATSPAMLLQGLVLGFIGIGSVTMLTGILVMVIFLGFWTVMLREVES